MDPCPTPCGLNSQCQVINHSPICSCRPGYTGDAFSRCFPQPRKQQQATISVFYLTNPKTFIAPLAVEPIQVPTDPCMPSPCGPNSQCRDIGAAPSCSCLPNYVGSPPNCRPECTINSECPSNQACIREKCRDPCPGSCGVSANCQVMNHIPVCSCIEGYTGDPFSNCYPKPPESKSI